MNKFLFSLVTFFFLPITFYGQSYIQMNQLNVQQNVQQNNFHYSNNLGLFSLAGAINSFTNAWKDENRKRREIKKAQSQLTLIKEEFAKINEFPKIIDGWHLVKVTDNFNYCSDAKALVKDNRITKIIIQNYSKFSMDFTAMTDIHNAQVSINWQLPSGQTDICQVYFAYDIQNPTIVDPPLNPGYVTFWSDHRKAKTIEIWISEIRQGQIKKQLESIHCGKEGALTLELKPGVYDFRGEANGALGWRGKIEIKENECFTYLLNRDNKD